MARLLKMPGVSADSDEALLEEWFVAEGSTVTAGTAVASVETEKAVVDIEIDTDSVIHKLLAESGSYVGVGEPMAVLRDVGEDAAAADQLVTDLGASVAKAPAEPVSGTPAEPVTTATEEPYTPPWAEDIGPAAGAGEPVAPLPEPVPADAAPEPAPLARRTRQFTSPLARRIAEQAGIDITKVTGTGPRGRVRRDDVLKAASDIESSVAAGRDESSPTAAQVPGTQAPVAPEPETAPLTTPDQSNTTPHSRVRRLIASRLQESKRNAPHFYLTRYLNVDALLELRERVNESSPTRVSINDFFVMAAARALIEVPEMNVIWTEDAVVSSSTADVAVAVASDRGLLTPVIRGVESMAISTLSLRIKDAVTRANAGRLQQSELTGGTLAITNLGMYGVEEFAAIINPPQVGILAVAAGRRRPVVTDDGDLGIATMIAVTLSVDHRPVDGVVAANWLAALARLIESPFRLLL